MDQLLTKLAVEVPALMVMVIIVFLFLKHLRGQNEFIQTLHRESMEARVRTCAVIERNSEVSGENTVALAEVARALRDLRGASHPSQSA